MIVCLLIAFLVAVPIVAFVGVLNPAIIEQSPTLVSMNATAWSTLYNNTYAAFGLNTIIIVIIVGALLITAIVLTSKSIKKEEG